MRGFFRKWGAVALALVLSLSVFAGMDGSSVQAAEDHAEDWMADIDGETMLSSISIPGTHDSATQYVGMRYIFQCQDTSIAQQLVDGYRYFDMRLVLDGKEDEQTLILKHNFAKCKEGGGLFAKALKLSNVLSDVYAFLQEHPSETVILCMKAENSKDDVAQVQKLLYEQIDQNPQMWYLANEIPTLEQVRGKIVLATRFEDAMEYRDLIRSIQKIGERQKIIGYGEEDKDIIAVAMDESLDLREQDAVVQVFFVRGGKLIGREHFYLRVARGDTKAQVLSSFMKQFYAGTPFIPREIMLQKEIEDAKIIEEWLTDRRKQRVYIRVPKKGTKEKLVELAEENAKMVLDKDRERIKREEGRTIGAVHEVEEWLGLSGIRRMEAYDISNISGFESVGSMVVYEKGKPKRSDYRKFKIKWVQGPNDYASMEEVLTRRFTHEGKDEFDSFSIMPDLILMDGGRGQVNIALKVLDNLGIEIPVCGMVKDDHHRTRGLYYNNLEIPIDTDSEGFRLITRIQDEAHRFAIEFHRSLRSKEQVHSLLDDIPGIGETRRKALMRKFKSIENIRDASLEEIAETESMNAGSAQKVYEFFHGASVPTS